MTRKPKTVAFWRGQLPHWEVEDGRYFVTIHLAGAIPKQGQSRIQAIAAGLRQFPDLQHDERLKIQRRVFAEMEAWLDRAHHCDSLCEVNVAAMISDSIAFREGRDWRMFEFIIMPNHVHLFFELVGNQRLRNSESRLRQVIEQFKRWTGHEAGKLLSLDGDRFWQGEWFDHWSRSDEEDEKICAYIRRNPEKAGLVKSYLDWPYGSWSQRK